jgi:hypothetical protein
MRNYTAVLARLKAQTRSNCAEFMVDGVVHSIQKTKLAGVFRDAIDEIDTPESRIVLNASASRGAGMMCSLVHMVAD